MGGGRRGEAVVLLRDSHGGVMLRGVAVKKIRRRSLHSNIGYQPSGVMSPKLNFSSTSFT